MDGFSWAHGKHNFRLGINFRRDNVSNHNFTFTTPFAEAITLNDFESGVAVGLDQVGEQHILSQIKTPEGTYTIDNRREVEKLIKLAQSNDHNPTTGVGAAGSQ